MAKTNVFPLYLDAGVITVSADDNDFTATSSRVLLDGTSSCDVQLNDAAEIGTLVRFEHRVSNANDPTVLLKTSAAGTSLDTLTFANLLDTATVIYFEDGWRVVEMTGTTTLGA